MKFLTKENISKKSHFKKINKTITSYVHLIQPPDTS